MGEPREATTVAGEIGQKIRALRDQRGWSQELLAGLSGLSSESIRRFERGLKSPRAESLMRIAAAFEVRVDDLMPDDYASAFTGPALERLGQLLRLPEGKLAAVAGESRFSHRSSAASNRSAAKPSQRPSKDRKRRHHLPTPNTDNIRRVRRRIAA